MKMTTLISALMIPALTLLSDIPAVDLSQLFTGRATWQLEEMAGEAVMNEEITVIPCTGAGGDDYFFCKGITHEPSLRIIVVMAGNGKNDRLFASNLQPAGIIRTLQTVEAQ